MSVAKSARGVVELTRPVNAIVAGVLTVTGAFVAIGSDVSGSVGPVLIASLVTILATAAGNTTNDYFDIETDQINNPERPIPRGAVAPSTALGSSIVLFAAAGALALVLPLFATAIALLNIVLLVAYTEIFKGMPGVGNAVVAYLGGSTFLLGGAAVGDIAVPGVLFLLAALATFSREVIKDVEDMEGDEREEITTLPLVIGEKRSLTLSAGFLCLMVVVTPVPYLLGVLEIVYLVLMIPVNGVILYAGYLSFGDPKAGQSVLKYGSFLTAAAFIVGRATMIS
ncbi:geranylgeranylglycerol-phosphate geranylgeranyltransferase [Natronococcus sp. A-GB1]|uniref:geranylgeranylglycerol-phosphate geranylgeranyltransferase n=1 Tax=Natronococcus sp. A-GB1 TaxID=3037648 RepID=UPI00241D7EED|nr:geranylgeranylglycerol-phosphate geranylgeranyltransferase [Natronococcus sp. A-GB1]MDG5761885.1 geranylgeranylglycerol-phosphate geranylgeranyltransferase [Natronococcus sp. A-GB1]